MSDNIFIHTAICAFFPRQCICCGNIIDEDEKLCDRCYKRIERCNAEKRCIKCGLEKGNCDCKSSVFHFEGCISPFKNIEIARHGFYLFKFNHKRHFSAFFAENMSISIRTEYSDIKFDGVCYVPTTFIKKLRRGYNQSEILASRIAQLLNLPLLSDALKCCHGGAPQHTLSGDERFDNVRGLYKYTYKNNGRTLLLVDDIKTTGATLDECSRQLLFSGADKVYCVTALISGNL